MWLEAILTAADLQKVVDQLTPASVPLGERGHLFFDAPAQVALVADRGLRVQCHAKVMWPVLGIDVQLTIRSMTLLVLPSIESRDGERVIVLAPEVDAIDLVLLPDIGDDELRAYLNRELQQKRIELPWNYQSMLTHRIPLPDWFRESSTFDICAGGAAMKITDESMGLAIRFTAEVTPSHPGEARATTGSARAVANGSKQVVHEVVDNAGGRMANAWRSRSNGVPSGIVPYRSPRRAGVGFAIAAGFGLGCLLGLWGTSRGA
jgi:hypothetical protein